MTKKDYELIAGAISDTRRAYLEGKLRGITADDLITHVVNFMADALERENPKFDKIKFINLCSTDTD